MTRRLLVLLLLGAALPVAASSAPLSEPPVDSTIVMPAEGYYRGIHWRIDPPYPCEGEDVRFVFDFCTCNIRLLRDADTSAVFLHVRMDTTIVCVACNPDTYAVSLGRFTAGMHSLTFGIRIEFYSGDTFLGSESTRHTVEFAVRRDCGPLPPPGPLPYVTQIVVGQRPPPCEGCPSVACPGDSIPVRIAGVFPDDCIRLESVRLVPSPVAGPMPVPPLLEIHYAYNSCIERLCLPNPVPWSAFVKLPPLPPGPYELLAQAFKLDACTGVDSLIGGTAVPFAVAELCTIPSAECFVLQPPRPAIPPGSVSGCTAVVGLDQPAVVRVAISSGVALAGLQGDLWLSPPGLQVRGMRAIGVAAGMHLQWTPRPDGAGFVLFAESGAPIPDSDLQRSDLFLEVTLHALPDAPVPDRTLLLAGMTLGSDSLGNAVPHCLTIAAAPSVLLPLAVICRDAPCDLNTDGLADIRDLVLMVHCVLESGACPDTATASLDCDRDGAKTIDDVLCCASAILNQGMPPDTSGGRVEPAVALSVGDPRLTATGVDLPLRLAGSDRVGAARLELVYPSSRFDVGGVEVVGDPAGWLDLYQATSDRLVIGLIGLGGEASAADVELIVHLSLKPGQKVGGEVALVGTQFSGTDGVTLRVDAGQPVRPLGPPARVALSHGHPNPFRSETRFTVTLSEAAELDVSVFDLQGRKVTTLFAGPAAEGSRDFVWRRGDSPVPSGVYFVRAAARGTIATRKVLLLGGVGPE